eukprot:scaffold13223_cov61-Phaeocystis_antarctica.AAC.2
MVLSQPQHESSQPPPQKLLHERQSQPQAPWYVPLRTRRQRQRQGYAREGSSTGAGRADRPAGVVTRSVTVVVVVIQPPPIARAVDFARDRRFVRRVVSFVVRWEPPAANFGEQHREVEEHRISGSLHRPASK